MNQNPIDSRPLPQLHGAFLAVDSVNHDTILINLDHVRKIRPWRNQVGSVLGSSLFMPRGSIVDCFHSVDEITNLVIEANRARKEGGNV